MSTVSSCFFASLSTVEKTQPRGKSKQWRDSGACRTAGSFSPFVFQNYPECAWRFYFRAQFVRANKMTTRSGWDPGLPHTTIDGGPTIPPWMGGIGIGELQILSLYAADKTTNLCPFKVGASMRGLVGDIENTTTEANGNKYVLRIRDAKQAEKLLKMTTLIDGTKIIVEMHPILNKRRCVISCREILNTTEDELLKELADEKVIAVKRITRKQDGKIVNTPTIILTLNGTRVPEHIKVGPLRIRTRTYIPDPMLCYRCYEYGHTRTKCKAKSDKCRNCSVAHDLEGECTAAPFCQNCKQDHSPASRQCPTYQREKEIVRLRFTKGISHQEATKQFLTGGGSYAAVSQIQQRLITAQQNHQENEELKEKDEIIKQLTEKIAKLTERIEELEKRKRKKNKKRAKQSPEESHSEMDTESSITHPTEEADETSIQVNVTDPNPIVHKHKRHPTTDLFLENFKKAMINIDPPPKFSTPPPTTSNSAVKQQQNSTRIDSTHTKSNYGQHNKSNK